MVQGAPTSPVISNIVMRKLDEQLSILAESRGYVLTRYADDIVVSGTTDPPSEFLLALKDAVLKDGWVISRKKERFDRHPNRLKVHGLLVHGKKLRLTKGYRNKIRAYKHLIDSGRVRPEDRKRMIGHLNYSNQLSEIGDKEPSQEA